MGRYASPSDCERLDGRRTFGANARGDYSWGTYEGQQTVTGTLETIGVEAERVGMKAPAVIIVGEVVRLRERLKWFEQSLEGIKDEELESVFAMA